MIAAEDFCKTYETIIKEKYRIELAKLLKFNSFHVRKETSEEFQ